MTNNNNILQYESKVWNTADLLRGCGIKESEWPSYMMPFFALVMIESRLIRMFDELKDQIGEDALAEIDKEDFIDLIKGKGQGYNIYISSRIIRPSKIFAQTINHSILTLTLICTALTAKLRICLG